MNGTQWLGTRADCCSGRRTSCPMTEKLQVQILLNIWMSLGQTLHPRWLVWVGFFWNVWCWWDLEVWFTVTRKWINTTVITRDYLDTFKNLLFRQTHARSAQRVAAHFWSRVRKWIHLKNHNWILFSVKTLEKNKNIDFPLKGCERLGARVLIPLSCLVTGVGKKKKNQIFKINCSNFLNDDDLQCK